MGNVILEIRKSSSGDAALKENLRRTRNKLLSRLHCNCHEFFVSRDVEKFLTIGPPPGLRAAIARDLLPSSGTRKRLNEHFPWNVCVGEPVSVGRNLAF